MKITQNNVIDLIKKNSIKALLIYGPDKGAISIVLDKIAKEIGAITKKEYYEVNHCLLTLLNSHNLFYNKEAVFIQNCPNIIDAEMKFALNQDFDNFPVFIADELSPSSSFRQFFEKEEKIGILACYQETFVNAKKYILQYMSSQDKSITIDAARFLAENLKSDKLLINNELNKLIALYNDKNNIDLADVKECVYIGLSSSFDMLCIYFAKKQLHEYLNELSKLLNNGTSNISILRSLVKYYINLYSVKIKGINYIAKIKPPIFFLYLEDFKSILHTISKDEIVKILELLFKAEVAIKESSSYTDPCYELFVRAHYDQNSTFRYASFR